MKYSELTELYDNLDSTTKRLEKTSILSDFLKKVSSDDIGAVVLLVQGRVFPAYDEREIGVANQLLMKAISIASGMETGDVEKEWANLGDLGKVAELLIKKKKQSTLVSHELTVKKVFDNLRKLTELTGHGSVDRKLQLIAELLSSAKGSDARYITRTVLGQLRVGIGEGGLRDAIAWAYFPKVVDKLFVRSGKEIKEKKDAKKDEELRREYNKVISGIQEAYDLTNDFGIVAKKAKESGLKGLGKVEIKVGTPIKVMLALKTESAGEALETVGKPAQCEYKYDGFRLECHRNNDDIYLYTRRLENVSEQFPEVVEYLKEYVTGTNYIIDSEAVGFDPKTLKYVPFQKISQRIKRKYDIEKMAKELPVEVNVFDVLSYDGKNMISEPFKKRRELVEKIVNNTKRKIVVSKAMTTDSEEKIEEFFTEAKAYGTEGLIIKNIEAPYKPGGRVGYMLKFKKVMENLDLVVVGAEKGEGKRSEWLSSFDLACRDGDKFLTVGKVATGLKEKKEEGLSFGELTEELRPLITETKGKHVLVKPKVVLEVAYEEIQKSPTYESGYALRFPRVIRERTSEKSVHDSNTVSDVERLYKQQKKDKA
jgi:DNA ligase 1